MNALTAHGISSVFHYAPLHYLVFIARSDALISKEELTRDGYPSSHFRSTSRGQDISRGFGHYVHLTLEEFPPIVEAKLKRGFPHFTIQVPAGALENVSFDLCRYNIAKTRYLRRGEKPGPIPCSGNGFYYGDMQLPIARSGEQQKALLEANHRINMIEVLVPKRLYLPKQTRLLFHDADDLALATNVVQRLQPLWACSLVGPQHRYTPVERYVRAVRAFLDQSIAKPGWKGNGMEFDRV